MPDDLDASNDPSNDPRDDPAQQRVRRLLAEARHDAPVPDDVAARLDTTLARLAAERRRDAVVDLAAARRRRRWTTGLVAAAAVVVLGISLPTLTGGLTTGGDSDAGGAADTSASQGGSVSREQTDEPGAEEPDEPGADSGGGGAAESAPSDATAPFSAPVEVDPDRFEQDAVAARDAVADQAELEARPFVCGEVPEGAEQVVVVRYDDQDGYLVFEPEPEPESEAGPEGEGRQRVTLFLCPGGVPARQALVAGP